MKLSELFTGFDPARVAEPGTLALSGDHVESALAIAGFPVPVGWRWPEPAWWREGEPSDLLYLARGPGMSVKIGISSRPLQRVRTFGFPREQSCLARWLDAPVPIRSRLLVVISKCGRAQERCLLDLVSSERVHCEWSRGPLSELLIAALCGAAGPFSSLEAA